MALKIWLTSLLLLTLHFCHSKPVKDGSVQMAKSYAAYIAKYNRLVEDIDANLKSIDPGSYIDEFNIAYNRIKADKKMELEKLLKENEKSYPNDRLELLRSKIMIEINRLDDAEKILNRLSLVKSELAVEVTLQKVIIYLLRRHNTEALTLFKEIESKLKKDSQFFQIYLALALLGPEAGIREEYSLKFVNSPELPVAMQPFRSRVYSNLAILAKEKLQLEKAKDYLEKAYNLNSIPSQKTNIQAELKHIALLNQPAPPLQGEIWFNTTPLKLDALKGKVVVIDFWAPWCSPCRELMPKLLDEFRQFAKHGLQIIGYTKLYGRFNDGIEKKEKVSTAEELAMLKNYLDNNKITFPIAVATEGVSFETYAVAVIPTIIVIDRRGNINRIESGTGNFLQIKDQIKSLLAEK